MKFDVHAFKENVEDVKKYKQLQQQLEKEGKFHQDVDGVSYEGALPVTEDFPFIKKGIKNSILKCFYLKVLKKYSKIVNKELTNLKVVGKENLKGVKAAIVTCNHISKVDSFAVREAVGYDINYVANDYNNWKGILGDVGRNTGFIPISPKLDRKIMKKFNEAMEYYLEKKKKRILIYPEQAMWREEPRPRPLKDGAFHYAVKHNVPVIPLFITFTPKAKMIDEHNRQEFSDYTIHILPPIYKKEELNNKENVEYMKNENARLWKETYETTYNKKLEFNIDQNSNI